MLTVGGVQLLVQGSNPSEGEYYIFQVIHIEDGVAKNGRRKVVVTVSDGVTCIDCVLAPQLYHYVDEGKCSVYYVIRVHKFTTNKMDSRIMIILLDVSIDTGLT
jgi:hypothetical protein